MNDQIAVLLVVGLAVVFFGLWIYSGKQKRKFEDEQRKRKQELERIKREAREK
jgi:hypothetical protein